MDPQAKRTDVSWEIIEHEYRTGSKSIREIGREHNISDAAIRQKAKKSGWDREKDQPDPDRHPNDPTKDKDGLTPQTRILVEEYLIEPNAAKAGEKAGLHPRYAQEQVLHNPAVALAIGKGQAERAERAGLDADYVLERLIQVVERCLQHEAVLMQNGERLMIETEEGEIAAAFTFQSAGANRALELLGKHLRLFAERVEHEHEHTHEHEHFIIVTTADIDAEIEEAFRGPARLPPPLTPTKH